MTFLLLSMLVGCPAESLGVRVPTSGLKAVTAEDLRRDAESISRSDANPAALFKRRLEEMELAPTEVTGDRVCARRAGEGKPRLLVASWPVAGPAQAENAATAAVLISIAKGWHGKSPTGRPTWVCLARSEAPLPDGERVGLGSAIDTLVKVDRLEAINYQTLQEETQRFLLTLEP